MFKGDLLKYQSEQSRLKFQGCTKGYTNLLPAKHKEFLTTFYDGIETQILIPTLYLINHSVSRCDTIMPSVSEIIRPSSRPSNKNNDCTISHYFNIGNLDNLAYIRISWEMKLDSNFSKLKIDGVRFGQVYIIQRELYIDIQSFNFREYLKKGLPLKTVIENLFSLEKPWGDESLEAEY